MLTESSALYSVSPLLVTVPTAVGSLAMNLFFPILASAETQVRAFP